MTAITVTYTGPAAFSPDLGKLTAGTTAVQPVNVLTSPNWTTTKTELEKATKTELEDLARALGVDPADGSKTDVATLIAGWLPTPPKPVKTEETANAD